MSEFKEGQRVKVEYEGTVQSVGGISIGVSRDNGGYSLINTSLVKVTLLDPPDWPPQAGDIWEAQGQEWFTRKGNLLRFYLVSSEPGSSREVEDFKALNPILVRRRGQ